ncbi:PqiC family protein [Shewanella algae]
MRIILFSLLLVLAGCSSQPQVTTYFLGKAPQATSEARVKPPLRQCQWRLAGVEMADFLAGNGLVYQVSNHELAIARQHLWAGDISEQIKVKMASLLAHECPREALVNIPAQEPLTLTLRFNEFHGRYSGDALLGGDWRISNSAGEQVLQADFHYDVPLASDGYPALVESLSLGLEKLARDIDAGLESLNLTSEQSLASTR